MQVLVDHGLVVTTYFLKSSDEGSGYGGDWVVRVKVEEEEEEQSTRALNTIEYVLVTFIQLPDRSNE